MCFIYKTECYSAFKEKEILSLGTIYMNLEDIMLSEISQTQRTNTIQCHLEVESQRIKLTELENRMKVARAEG